MQEVILVCNRKFDWLKSQKEISESLFIKHKLDEATSRNIYANLKLFGCKLKSKLEKTKIKKLQIQRERNNTPPSHSKAIPMKKDGNCFFRCLAETCLENAELHADIKDRVVCFMEMHKNTYVELIDGDFDEHIKLMRLAGGGTGSWAAEAEMCTAARCFEVDIYVRRKDGLVSNWLKLPFSEGCKHTNKFICITLEGEYFDLLMGKNRPCFCDKQIYEDINHQPLVIWTVTLSTVRLKTNRKNPHINEQARNKYKNKRKTTQ